MTATKNAGDARLEKSSGVEYIVFPSIERTGAARHCVSTRKGGVSVGRFASMNLGYGRGDDDERVRENFRRICDAAGISREKLVMSRQAHGARIHDADRAPEPDGNADGLMSSRAGDVLRRLRPAALPRPRAARRRQLARGLARMCAGDAGADRARDGRAPRLCDSQDKI